MDRILVVCRCVKGVISFQVKCIYRCCIIIVLDYIHLSRESFYPCSVV